MNAESSQPLEIATDVCALPLARRLAAMLDRDPAALREGDPLPRGWHPMLFNVPTRQSQLRHDGAADLGVTLPDLGLPRLMLGGRQARFNGDIAIGARVRRESRQRGVTEKHGRSGRFALVGVEHRIFVEDGDSEAVVVETQDYIMREASGAGRGGNTDAPAAPAAAGNASPMPPVDAAAKTPRPLVTAERTLVPDGALLFRYSAITDNPHRIHYDQPYATEREGYPGLVVNGSIPAMFLLELFRAHARREPVSFSSRNIAAMFAGRRLRLCAHDEGAAWRLWAESDEGVTTFDARAE
jgi:3-methylfumaryl-CoA hydratase